LEANTSTLAACASTERLVDVVVAALCEAERFEILRVHSAEDIEPIAERLDAAVLYNGRERPDFAFISKLQTLGERMPLVVIGGDAASMGGVACWLPSLPPRAVFGALVSELIAAGPKQAWQAFGDDEEPTSSRGTSWRRKGDMILGESRATKRLLHELNRLTPTAGLVLITGESGTGKELVARALHYGGPRANEPFIALNCAAIPETLVEAELFGYQRGAFTGAVATRVGAFEAARRGTLFLDEIGDMPRSVQAKLLRVLERNEVVRLGSSDLHPVHARIVAASNRDLRNEVKVGNFREDLFYRLSSFPVHIEPLRRRPEDIPPIVAHHLGIIAARENRTTPRITAAAVERLLGHSWPGNVRELVHVLGRALLACTGNVLEAEHIDLPPASGPGSVDRYRDAKQRFEAEYYGRLMRVANGNVAFAARLADKTRKEVYDALKRLGIDAVEYRVDD
jgi:transcriptional regulator with GAF, ATPase, and Fis domain